MVRAAAIEYGEKNALTGGAGNWWYRSKAKAVSALAIRASETVSMRSSISPRPSARRGVCRFARSGAAPETLILNSRTDGQNFVEEDRAVGLRPAFCARGPPRPRGAS